MWMKLVSLEIGMNIGITYWNEALIRTEALVLRM